MSIKFQKRTIFKGFKLEKWTGLFIKKREKRGIVEYKLEGELVNKGLL